ncbi:MAG: cytochrome c [Chlorobi bacterium]|nr:cytochrome c [Chlorobiota bacterium]
MTKTYALLIVAGIMLSGCVSEDHPGYIWYPDMFTSKAWEPLDQAPFGKDSAMRFYPPEGVIPYGAQQVTEGYFVYTVPNTPEGYEQSKSIKNTLPKTEEVIAKGKQLYEIYCAPCHGTTGEGNGPVVEVGGFPPPPTYYQDRIYSLADGQMFHVITYGKNLMGSFRYQLTPEERWAVVHYIRHLQDQRLKKEGKSLADYQQTQQTDTLKTL